jgi:hypothetical protein
VDLEWNKRKRQRRGTPSIDSATDVSTMKNDQRVRVRVHP